MSHSYQAALWIDSKVPLCSTFSTTPRPGKHLQFTQGKFFLILNVILGHLYLRIPPPSSWEAPIIHSWGISFFVILAILVILTLAQCSFSSSIIWRWREVGKTLWHLPNGLMKNIQSLLRGLLIFSPGADINTYADADADNVITSASWNACLFSHQVLISTHIYICWCW